MGLCYGSLLTREYIIVKYQNFFVKKIFFICFLSFFVYKAFKGY